MLAFLLGFECSTKASSIPSSGIVTFTESMPVRYVSNYQAKIAYSITPNDQIEYDELIYANSFYWFKFVDGFGKTAYITAINDCGCNFIREIDTAVESNSKPFILSRERYTQLARQGVKFTKQNTVQLKDGKIYGKYKVN